MWVGCSGVLGSVGGVCASSRERCSPVVGLLRCDNFESELVVVRWEGVWTFFLVFSSRDAKQRSELKSTQSGHKRRERHKPELNGGGIVSSLGEDVHRRHSSTDVLIVLTRIIQQSITKAGDLTAVASTHRTHQTPISLSRFVGADRCLVWAICTSDFSRGYQVGAVCSRTRARLIVAQTCLPRGIGVWMPLFLRVISHHGKYRISSSRS